MSVQRVEDEIATALLMGPMNEVQKRISQTSSNLVFDHELIVRHYCVALAKIALAIIEKAPDTIWLTDTQTVVEYVLAELGIESDDMEKSLQEFINFEPKAKELWEKQKENLGDQKSEPKLEKQDQFDLCLQSKS